MILEADKLSKTFRLGFLRRRVEAVHDVSFSVEKNEVFGLVGPNGAGKTTTIKMLMGLIFPTRGSARIFGKPIGTAEARRRLGFLPENPYFYDYLTAAELLDLVGRLFGLGAAERAKRTATLLDRVGLDNDDKPLRKYSKGMLQRLGLAQALINDPELVVLDEPMSGLDPIGRKEIRDLIHSLKAEGKTVVFSTHILSDVELLCDRIALMIDGKLRSLGPLHDLLSPRLLHTELVIDSDGKHVLTRLGPDADVAAVLKAAVETGKKIISVTPRTETLEQLFVREVGAGLTSDRAGPQAKPEDPVPASENR